MSVINAIHLEGGNNHEHITTVRYEGSTVDVSLATAVVAAKAGGLWSKGRRGAADAKVHPARNTTKEFIESRADAIVDNNLLSQPRF
jgi:hypothetical protein